jgi:single-strand DNA-binding protein
MNQVLLTGHLGKAPKVGEKNGREFAMFSLATKEVWKDKNGELQEHTDWHWIVVFNGQVQGVRTLKAGDRVLVEGQLRYYQRERDGVEYTACQVLARRVEFQKLKGRGEQQPAEPEIDLDDIPF